MRYNKPSPKMLLNASTLDERYTRLFQWFHCKRIIMDPSYCLIGEPSTVNDWMDIHGRVGISFESGQLTDVSKVKETYESILNILRHHGLVEESPSRDPYYSMDNWDFYEKKSSVVMTGAGWEFASGRGERNFEPFHKDEVLGYHGSEPFRAPHDGYIMFPKIKELQAPGKPVIFLAVKK